MTYPTYYLRSKDFSEDVGSNSDHNAINAELDALALSIQQVIDNLKVIQRADNALANNTVGTDQLAGNITLTVVEGVSEAQAAQSAAEAAQAAAEAAQTAAETAETNAETAETNAEAAEALAEKWATNPEDVVVADGKYSAYHWAQKATEIGDVSGKVDKVPSATLNNIWKVGTGGVLVDSGIAAADVSALISGGGTTTATLAAYGDCDTSIANTEFVQTAVAGANNQAPPQKAFSNSQAFTSSGTFTVPAGVTTVYVTACGGGGGGGSGGVYVNTSPARVGGNGGRGGNSVPCYREKVTVTAGASITVTIGTGGSAGTAKTNNGSGNNGGNGGTTSFGALLTVAGGLGGLGGAGGAAYDPDGDGTNNDYPDQDDRADTFQTGYTRYAYFDTQDAPVQTASGLALELATRTKIMPYKAQQKGAMGTEGKTSAPTAGGTGVTYGAGGGGGGGTNEGYDPSGAGGAGRGGYLKVEW
jgi:hypothetical protein